MKITIDVQPLLGAKSGVGYYIWGLIHGLSKVDAKNDYRLSFFDFKKRGSKVPSLGANFQKVACPLPGRFIQQIWKKIQWPPYDFFFGEGDVYHFPNFVIQPLRRGKKVVTLHDVSFFRYPQYTESKNLKYLTTSFKRTLEVADQIIADSLFTKQELLDLFKIDEKRIHVIHLGLASHFVSVKKTPERQILFVGTLEPRKNLEGLLKAFEIFLDKTLLRDYRLVIAGMRGWLCEGFFKALQRHRYRDRIQVLDYVSEDELIQLYQSSMMFVYPSFYEGFGLPPLEAMASGIPVIASRKASLPEVLGDAALWIENPEDTEELASGLEKMARDQGLRKDFIQKGLEQVKKFDWEKSARQTLEVYESCFK
ncbi:MAG: glycosyltransferase family 4 protein [Chlamydiae bacterium]|nr:glycosyltransferase family 4 protein [Chlamydiota bacterium]MBI3266082.1 glycosyltransferase family 4 protein [Chlamydiota bacterium]